MSVLIKGIECPKSCYRCQFAIRLCTGDICPFLKRFINVQMENKGKDEECPLVDVPTPHGRLIDADWLKELFPDNNSGQWTYNITAKYYVDAQPTVIETEGAYDGTD